MRVKGSFRKGWLNGELICEYTGDNNVVEIEIPEEEILKLAEEIKKEKRFHWCFDCEYSNFDCNAKNCIDKNSTARIKKNFKPKEQTKLERIGGYGNCNKCGKVVGNKEEILKQFGCQCSQRQTDGSWKEQANEFLELKFVTEYGVTSESEKWKAGLNEIMRRFNKLCETLEKFKEEK